MGQGGDKPHVTKYRDYDEVQRVLGVYALRGNDEVVGLVEYGLVGNTHEKDCRTDAPIV